MSAFLMRDTEREDKRRFGSIAYLWTGLKKLFGLQPHRFTIVVDDRVNSVRASEVTVANSGAIGDPAFRWGPQVRLDDGQLDACVVRAWAVTDYPRLAWSVLLGQQRHDPNIRYLRAARSIAITASQPLLVQGDGEFIGHTPVQVDVVPGVVHVIVPPTLGGARHTRDSSYDSSFATNLTSDRLSCIIGPGSRWCPLSQRDIEVAKVTATWMLARNGHRLSHWRLTSGQ